MDGNDQADDFDEFFDTPGRSIQESTDLDKPKEKTVTGKSSTILSSTRSDKKCDSAGERRSLSSDRVASVDYSSDSVSESESEFKKQKRRKSSSRSRSRSSSSNTDSDGSYSSSPSSKNSQKRDSNPKARRRSQSTSSSRSSSRTTSPDVSVKRKVMSRRKDSYSSVTSSSSTYSESRNSGRHSPSPKNQKNDRRQAWNTEAKSNDRKAARPKTAKRRSSNDKYTQDDGSRRRERKEKRSPSDSDSDMTDVSPILSPRNGSFNGHNRAAGDRYFVANPNKFQAMPMSRHIFDGGDSQALDLNILMKAVSELEKQKRVQANTRRVMFEPMRPKPREKSNYTFNDDDTHRIDQENQRLLKKIMRQMHPSEKKTQPKIIDVKLKQAVITPSAINRRKEQQRIESENLSFLKRLQKVRASKGLSRDEQLSAYNTTVLHGIPIAALHPDRPGSRRSGRQSSASSVVGSLSRTRSLTSVHSATTTSSFGTASRQSSRAGSRPGSAKRTIEERPAWNDRW